jgi:hypothetical protein
MYLLQLLALCVLLSRARVLVLLWPSPIHFLLVDGFAC